MAAADEAELVHMVHTMALHDSVRSQSAIPAATARASLPASDRLEIGKGRIVREGKKVAILSLGPASPKAEKAADILRARGSAHVADCASPKPLD
jgi:1-deoxy-D-xylulose-5-phosphate synthase